MEKEEENITKEGKGEQLSNWLHTDEQDDGFVELRYSMKSEQAELLNYILFHADYNDLEQMKEKIYSYGRSLHAKDQLGRALFVCMAAILGNASLLGQRGY